MMKHLKEEKDGFRSVIKIAKLLLLIPFLAATFYSQINLNGFVEITSIPAPLDASKILSAQIDSDAEHDFLLTSFGKNIYLKLSTEEYKQRILKTPFEISEIKRVRKLSNNETLFAFISRKDRVFGTFIINNNGQLGLLRSTKLKYHPENFILTRTARKALIFGNNYNGLTLLDLDLEDKDILELQRGTLTSNVLFYDFDNDSNTDIVYYDIFSKALKIIRNENNYQLDKINFSKPLPNVTKIRKFDYDFDGFEDILFSTNNTIEIFYGDTVTTFENSELLIKENGIVDFQVGDFNKDGYSDIVYLKKNKDNSSQLSVSFSSSDQLSKPILFSNINNIRSFDVIGWRKDKIVYLTDAGNINVISSIDKIENTFLQLGTIPRKIILFKLLSNNLVSLAIVDSADSKVKLFLSALSSSHEIPLKYVPGSLLIDQIDENTLTLTAFTKGDKLIEFVRFSLTDNTFSSKQFYTKSGIVNLIQEKKDNKLPLIAVLTEDNGKIMLEEFEYRNVRYQKSPSATILENTYEAKFTGNKSLVYVQMLPEEKLIFGEKSLKDVEGVSSQRSELNMELSELQNVKIHEFEFRGKIKHIISVSTESGNHNFLSAENKIHRIDINKFIDKIDINQFSKNSFLKIIYSNVSKIYSAELNINNGRIRDQKEIADYMGQYVIEFVNENYGYIFMLNYKTNLTELRLLDE